VTPKEKAKDKRLRKTYGWTLEMYNALLAEQGGVCAGCGKSATLKRMNLDHYHFHIRALNSSNGIMSDAVNAKWVARANVDGCTWHWGNTKKAVTEAARKEALPLSVRGILCAGRYGTGCNTKMGRADDPVWHAKISVYLKNPPAKKILQRFRP
jgi:hypothetical protein